MQAKTFQAGGCCGHVSADNRRTQAQFECVECGFAENTDVVGAINVLRAGHARLACEVNGAVMPSAPPLGRRASARGKGGCQESTTFTAGLLL